MNGTNSLESRLQQPRKQGIALVIVISMLAFLTVLVVAMLSLSQNERASSVQSADGATARQLADTAVNMMMSQIWEGTKPEASSENSNMWASQPGGIRRYNSDGTWKSGHKLYTTSKMTVVGGSEKAQMIDQDKVPMDWNTKPEIYVDLNEPVIRPDADKDTFPEIYFPIVDPRAYIAPDGDTPNPDTVEGFSYQSNALNGASPSKDAKDITARVPMPVQWLYVLKNGAVGHLEGSDSSFVFKSADGVTKPTADNPIVGRVAAWTDDESCRININTAGEPAYWTTPNVQHLRDYTWAFAQPTSNEYQRYPGHPATIALSTVLFPNEPMDLYGLQVGSSAYKEIWERKERIYAMMPKLNSGGSKAGSSGYWNIDLGNGGAAVDLAQSQLERLYASVDELMFSEKLNPGTGERLVQDDNETVKLFKDAQKFERSRFFLSAHSRSPELTMFGTPRVAIWPITDEQRSNNYRTGYDNLIAFCSSLKGQARDPEKSFAFRRLNADSATIDINLPRNKELISYLFALLDRKMPGGKSFREKYGDANTMGTLVQIFDYIRSTNLYDGYLAPTENDLKTKKEYNFSDASLNTEKLRYVGRDKLAQGLNGVKTYTDNRASSSGGAVVESYPGHGQVVPAELTYQGNVYKGHGRFLTLSELGLQFICTADGMKDKGSYRIREKIEENPAPPAGQEKYKKSDKPDWKSGGRTAIKMKYKPADSGKGQGLPYGVKDKWLKGQDVNKQDDSQIQHQAWYSNYPPHPAKGLYGTDPSESNKEHPRHPSNHPGYQPENWNITLDDNAPLAEDERRIQAMLNLEMFCSSLGYTHYHADFSVVVEGMDALMLDGKALFPSTPMVWKSGSDSFKSYHGRPVGGFINNYNMAESARVRPLNRVGTVNPLEDYNYDTGNGIHDRLNNFDFVSDFVTVKIKDPSKPTMKIEGKPLKIKIFAGHDFNLNNPNDKNLVQTIEIDLSTDSKTEEIPIPELVTVGTDYNETIDEQGNKSTTRAMSAPRWWAFHYIGALGMYSGTWDKPVDPIKGFKPNYATAGRMWAGSSGDTAKRDNPGQIFDNQTGDLRDSNFGLPGFRTLIFGYDKDVGGYQSGLINPNNSSGDVAADGVADTQVFQPSTPSPAYKSTNTNNPWPRGHDVLISMVPKEADLRLLALQKEVKSDSWEKHPAWKKDDPTYKADYLSAIPGERRFFAHGLTRGFSSSDPGANRGSSQYRLVPGANYSTSAFPSLAGVKTAVEKATRYGDYDSGIGPAPDGSYINRPDEGNTTMRDISFNSVTRKSPSAYFLEEWANEPAGENYMTPNRMVPSPVMFGSLLSQSRNSITSVNSPPEPWTTLLFRPYTQPTPGAVAAAGVGKQIRHPGAPSWWPGGGADPADHYLLDLFWMPVVEPYAISEPLSTAGKINMNYQIVPFQHIRRATGMHAALKGQMIHALPTNAANQYRRRPDGSKEYKPMNDNAVRVWGPWSDSKAPGEQPGDLSSISDPKYWHRSVNIEKGLVSALEGTLRQFEDRFRFGEFSPKSQYAPAASYGLFKSASQICEIFMVPKKVEGDPLTTGGDLNVSSPYKASDTSTSSTTSLVKFWQDRAITGDNLKERPYAELYSKLTTRSNTFRVFYRAQAIRKARSVAPDVFDSKADAVLSDYRGSAVLQRQADLNNIAEDSVADPAKGSNPTSLDEKYFIRIMENKRFAP